MHPPVIKKPGKAHDPGRDQGGAEGRAHLGAGHHETPAEAVGSGRRE
jgi:hypothetical protein